MVAFYNKGDQDIYKSGSHFVPQEKYRLGYTAPTVEEQKITETFGIPYTNAFTGGGGGGGGGPTFNYQSDKNYLSGGMYERNPLASGALDTMINNEGMISPNYNYGATGETAPHPSNEMGAVNTRSFTPLELSYMSELPSNYDGQDLSRMQKLNMMARNFKGINSAYGDFRTTGKLGEYADKGIGMIPLLKRFFGSTANALGLEMTGDRSDRQRWAVDGAGFGQGTGRDQFGVFTGGKTMFGKTADYSERMNNKISDIESFMGKRGIDFNDPNAYDKMKKINGSMANQYLDYKQKLGILEEDNKIKEAIERTKIDKRARDYYRREKIRKKTGEQGIYGLHKDEGKGDGPKITSTTTGGNGGNGGGPPGTWGGTGSVEAYDASQKATYDRAVDRHRGAKGGRIGYFYGGLASIL